MIKKSKIFNLRFAVVIVAAFVATFVAFSDFNAILYQTNILSLPAHEPFDGTVYPVQRVPNWTRLDSSKRDAYYQELDSSDFIAIPYYDPEVLAFDASDLVWGNAEHNKIRNAKITYSVPYMGNYRLDGLEYAGSHAAVDIKIPKGTPIYAMANGTVTKASTQTSGFGHHIVITHDNFPTLEDQNKRETIHSSYSHLSEVLVSVGDVVRKGDKIALSGDTGTATTPHLHFQIDRDTAPWSPYWPFTWAEVYDAGLDFFSAVNEGLGKEKAMEVTVHPMKYVQKYLDAERIYVEEEIGVASVSYVEEEDEDEEQEEEIEMGPEATSYVEPKVKEDSEAKEDSESNGAPESENPSKSEQLPKVISFPDLPSGHKYFDAVSFLAERGIVQGYRDGTFKSSKEVSRVEALKFILESIDAELESGKAPFSDVSENEWYSPYLYTGYKMDIVEGYPDGTFKPNNSVNKAEFLKILFSGMKVDINPEVLEAPFRDVAPSAWFAHYFSYARELGVIDSEVRFVRPANAMTRGEVADAMYRLIKLAE